MANDGERRGLGEDETHEHTRFESVSVPLLPDLRILLGLEDINDLVKIPVVCGHGAENGDSKPKLGYSSKDGAH